MVRRIPRCLLQPDTPTQTTFTSAHLGHTTEGTFHVAPASPSQRCPHSAHLSNRILVPPVSPWLFKTSWTRAIAASSVKAPAEWPGGSIGSTTLCRRLWAPEVAFPTGKGAHLTCLREGVGDLPDGRRLGYGEFGTRAGNPLLIFHGYPGGRQFDQGSLLGRRP
jgi:hypothetical protein